jgi:AraC-like DNA-binding protein/ligand-binding sensor protein
MPMVRDYELAFRKATGVALKLIAPGTLASALSFGRHQNEFCQLLGRNLDVTQECWKNEANANRLAGETRQPQAVRCFAGLHLLAAPVLVEGTHVATWVGGQVMTTAPSQAEFAEVSAQLTRWGMTEHMPALRSAFFGTRVVPADRLAAMKQLLNFCAQHLGDCAGRLWSAAQPSEPQAVANAKQYILTHLGERITLRGAATAAHTSPYHFCRLFRRTTGLTLTQYVAKARVEQAKELLSKGSLRVSEVAYAAGFGSIPQFNTLFRRHTGMSPTQYRDSRKSAQAP